MRYLIPLIINNDFPAEKNIKKITAPVVIVHSKDDDQILIKYGKKIFKAANKENTTFWEIEGEHIEGILDYEVEYVQKFKNFISK